jgi:hypothetical protein
MKIIIAGSRSITDFEIVKKAINKSGWKDLITEVVSGDCSGVDKLGEKWALANNKSVTKFKAKWDEHGRAAGPIRNGHMAEYAEALICIWDGSSSGSKNMIQQMKRLNKPTFIFTVSDENKN